MGDWKARGSLSGGNDTHGGCALGVGGQHARHRAWMGWISGSAGQARAEQG